MVNHFNVTLGNNTSSTEQDDDHSCMKPSRAESRTQATEWGDWGDWVRLASSHWQIDTIAITKHSFRTCRSGEMKRRFSYDDHSSSFHIIVPLNSTSANWKTGKKQFNNLFPVPDMGNPPLIPRSRLALISERWSGNLQFLVPPGSRRLIGS